MLLMPFHITKAWGRGLVALAPVAVGAYLVYRTLPHHRKRKLPEVRTARTPTSSEQDRRPSPLPRHETMRGAERVPGWNRRTAYFVAGAALLGWSLGGGRALALVGRRHGSRPQPLPNRTTHWLPRPDGTQLHVVCSGPSEGPPIVFVHGLGANHDIWFAIRERLVRNHRLVEWDLRGLGRSSAAPNNDYSMEALARDLEAVLAFVGDRPAVLVGHSLGGMILLTFCRLFPEALGPRVAGLVLAHTTYTNPTQTSAWKSVDSLLQKPVIEPLFRLTIALPLLARALGVLSYLSGEAHRALDQNMFVGRETRETLDFIAQYYLVTRPDVVGRMALAMLRYDETATLDGIQAPTLVVAGDRDEDCTPETHAFMRDHIPDAALLQLSPARHGGLLEYPEAFAEALERFAERASRGASVAAQGSKAALVAAK